LCLWFYLSMKDLLCPWNVLSIKCSIYEMSYLWFFFNEITFLWNVLLWNVHNYEMSFYEMSITMKYLSLKWPNTTIIINIITLLSSSWLLLLLLLSWLWLYIIIIIIIVMKSVCVGLYGICFGFTSSRIIPYCPRSGIKTERNWIFTTNSDFTIPISLQLNVVNLRYCNLWFRLGKYLRFTSPGCKDKGMPYSFLLRFVKICKDTNLREFLWTKHYFFIWYLHICKDISVFNFTFFIKKELYYFICKDINLREFL